MYENFRYMYNPYSPFYPSLKEYLDKGRKNHTFYGQKYSIEKDGYFDEYHEFRRHFLINGKKDLRYVHYKLEKRFKELNSSSDSGAFFRCYINLYNPDEYMVVTCSKKGSKRHEILKQIFIVLKDD